MPVFKDTIDLLASAYVLTLLIAFDHSRDRIRVNAIAPGFVFTGMSYPVQVVTDWIEASTPLGVRFSYEVPLSFH